MEHLRQPPALGEIVAGLVLSLTVPLVGFVVGGVWCSRGGRCLAAGATAVAFAIGALAFWLAFSY